MTLVLSNEDVQQVLCMSDCMQVLREAFVDYEQGRAANRPRSHTYTPISEDEYYLFKSMDGSVPRYGVHGLRLSSDRLLQRTVGGARRREKLPAGPGGTYLGLVMLFSIETLELLAILQDGYLQRTRVGATSGLAAAALARKDSRVVGMFGSGWQAEGQLLALQEVRELEEVKVYSPNSAHCAAFVARMNQQLRVPVRSVDSPQQVVDGSDIVVAATNSSEPVFDSQWVVPGQHVNSLQGRELDDGMLDKADVIVVRSRDAPSHWFAGDAVPEEIARAKKTSSVHQAKTFELGSVLAGKEGRTGEQEVTLFGGSGMGGSAGLGIQFAAVGHLVYERARAAGLGREVPSEWFLQTLRP